MALKYELLGKRDLKAASKPKSLFSSKRGRGTALVIAGSADFHGAPVLAALASLRVGAGYVKLYVPRSVVGPARNLSPNIIVGALGAKSITCNKQILDQIKRCNAIAIGMGIGRSAMAQVSARKIVQSSVRAGKVVVVDADAISSLKRLPVEGKLNQNIIATPHDGEFFRLTAFRPAEKDLGARVKTAAEWARKLGITLVLKGHYSIVTDGKRVKVNIAKTSALATMGTGDILSGIICGYAATGVGAFAAACAGVYLHSSIGDSLATKMGNHIIAADVVDAIPLAIKEFDKTIQ